MSKFKVGDKVECIAGSLYGFPGKQGDILTVRNVCANSVVFEEYPYCSGSDATRFKLVETKKETTMRYYGNIVHTRGSLMIGPYGSIEETMKWLDLESESLVNPVRSITIKDV